MTTCIDLYRSLASRRDFDAAAVSNFHHVPLSLDFDSNVTEKLIVETAHSKGNSGPIAYWLAAIVRKYGYLVELKWLGDNTNANFTRNFPCYKEPSPNDLDARLFPVGWALANNKLFEPPQEIREPPQGWRAFLEHKLHPKKGLDDNIYRVSQEENESCFKPGMLAEATDINRVNAISRVVVEDDIGRRLRLRYLSDANDRKICWFHDFSGELLPCGWAQIYGRELTPIPNQFNASMRAFVEAPMYDFKPFLISDFVYDTLRSYRFEVGHKLELIDPLEPNFIRVGTIMKVMRNQYLLINIDGSERDVCLHAFSPNLLPAGFAAKNGLLAHFQPPREDFSYKDSNVVPWRIFEKIIPRNTFKRNQFLEAVRVPGTNLLHIARIVRVVGHLVLVHFEGYPSSEDQFFPISSVDLYPVGWCHFVGHELQIPRGD